MSNKLKWLRKIFKKDFSKYKRLKEENEEDDETFPPKHVTYKKFSQPDLSQTGKGKSRGRRRKQNILRKRINKTYKRRSRSKRNKRFK